MPLKREYNIKSLYRIINKMSVYKVKKSANLNDVKNFVNGIKIFFNFFFIWDFFSAMILALVCFYLSVYIYNFNWEKWVKFWKYAIIMNLKMFVVATFGQEETNKNLN